LPGKAGEELQKEAGQEAVCGPVGGIWENMLWWKGAVGSGWVYTASRPQTKKTKKVISAYDYPSQNHPQNHRLAQFSSCCLHMIYQSGTRSGF